MTTAIIHRTDEPFIGTYRRPASCDRRPANGAVEPNYLVRRIGAAVVVVLAAIVVAMSLNGLLASFGGDPAAAAEASPANESVPSAHVARAGDTMWSIASSYRGSVSHDRYVNALIRLNGGVHIQIGQAVTLP